MWRFPPLTTYPIYIFWIRKNCISKFSHFFHVCTKPDLVSPCKKMEKANHEEPWFSKGKCKHTLTSVISFVCIEIILLVNMIFPGEQRTVLTSSEILLHPRFRNLPRSIGTRSYGSAVAVVSRITMCVICADICHSMGRWNIYRASSLYCLQLLVLPVVW